MQPNIWYMAEYMVYGHMYGQKIAIYMDMAIPPKNPVWSTPGVYEIF